MPQYLIFRRQTYRRRLLRLLATGAIILTVSSASAQDKLDLEYVLRTTLDRNVAILESAETTRLREAERQIFEGAFDLVVGVSAERARTGRLFSGTEQTVYNVSSAYTGVSSYRLAAVRLTRAGFTISPALQVTRHDALTLAAPSIIQTQAALEISYPVLNAGRRSPESADLSSAQHALQASRDAERHARARSVYRVGIAYWGYVGAFESLVIHRASEEKMQRLLTETQALVVGGERAASDLDQLRADLADRYAARISAEQRLFEARLQLGIEMGLRAEEAADLPPPSSTFPHAPEALSAAPFTILETLAAGSRADLAGIEKTLQAAADARYARSIEARPRLDVLLSVGYAGLSENRLTLGQHLPPFGQNDVSGTNGSLSLVLSWPASNHRALGRLERQTAVWRKARIARDDLARRIRSDLRTASNQLHSSISEVAKIEEAVELYATSVENERKKLQLGMSTQFDLILVEERLRNSLLARVAARMRYAGAIARLRYETGTLMTTQLRPADIARRLISPAIETE